MFKFNSFLFFLFISSISVSIFGSETENDLVFKASKEAELITLRDYIAKGYDFNIKDQYGLTPLWYVAHSGELESIKFLIENGVYLLSSKLASSDILLFFFNKIALKKSGEINKHTIQLANKLLNEGLDLIGKYASQLSFELKQVEPLVADTNRETSHLLNKSLEDLRSKLLIRFKVTKDQKYYNYVQRCDDLINNKVDINKKEEFINYLRLNVIIFPDEVD